MNNKETTCVHPYVDFEGFTNAVTSIISPSTSYSYLNEEELIYPGFYSTYNQRKLGNIISVLEHGVWGIAFSSGMAAITTVLLASLEEGDHILFFSELYGGTWKFAKEELQKRGIACTFVSNEMSSFEHNIQINTRAVYIETPTNPLLTLVDLENITTWAKSKGIISIIDNTFATPINQNPIKYGFDIVVHSGTKYLSGHNDLSFGIAVIANLKFKDKILTTAKLYGGSLSPTCCYQAERSIKTLALRVKRQNENALMIAEYLDSLDVVEKVYYPGLTSHPNHELAKKQMNGFGGMLSFEIKGDKKEVSIFISKLSIIKPALSLGGVESLICVPANTSHSSLTVFQRQEMGIKDNLLRLSVGIENAQDLIADLQFALSV